VPRVNLQKREKVVVGGGLALAVVILVWFGLQGPLNKYSRMETQARAATERVQTARLIRDEVLAERSGQKALQAALGGRGQGSLTSFVNSQLQQAGFKERATWKNNPRFADSATFEQLDVTLTGVTLEEVVNFLHGIYNGANVVLAHTLRIEPQNTGTGLTCKIVLLSPKV
jgi:hypothetical protein